MTTPEHAEAISGKYHWSFAKKNWEKWTYRPRSRESSVSI